MMDDATDDDGLYTCTFAAAAAEEEVAAVMAASSCRCLLSIFCVSLSAVLLLPARSAKLNGSRSARRASSTAEV